MSVKKLRDTTYCFHLIKDPINVHLSCYLFFLRCINESTDETSDESHTLLFLNVPEYFSTLIPDMQFHVAEGCCLAILVMPFLACQ